MNGEWHFQCPECGIGDGEIGEPAGDHDLTCMICLEERGAVVILRRWLPEDYARLRPDLAA
jgi:hypothetical protein